MPVTSRFYGGASLGAGRTIQDFGLCDLKGIFQYTTKLRAKGLLVVVFFSTESPASTNVVKTVQSWASEAPPAKWTPIALTAGDRDAIVAYGQQNGLDNLMILLDHEWYQTRNWGISSLPTVFLVQGKTGQILYKVSGDDQAELAAMQQTLTNEVAKIIAAEAAAKKADEEKKAAEAAAKAAEAAKAPAPA